MARIEKASTTWTDGDRQKGKIRVRISPVNEEKKNRHQSKSEKENEKIKKENSKLNIYWYIEIYI